MKQDSYKDKLSRERREKQGVYGDTRGKERNIISQAKPRGFRYLLICPLVIQTFNINDGFIGHRVQPRQ